MNQPFINNLLAFLTQSSTPFHATKNCVAILEGNGYQKLSDGIEWELAPRSKYFVTRNDSSIIAFNTGKSATGVNIVGAHTDSPCLKIKPQADISNQYQQLGVEVYGGALLNPWFDRDLSIAGRISGVTKNGERFDELIDFAKPIAIIPSLAIHLDKNANKDRTINAQKHLPLLLSSNTNKIDFRQLLIKQSHRDDIEQIFDYEMSCYDVQPAALTGLDEAFISSARLDNLLSTFIGLQALINSDETQASLFVSSDHEEVGSASACGAQGPFLQSTFEKLAEFHEVRLSQLVEQSRLISADNAHALHPNYRDKHDDQHAPLLNQGPVIKINANQRYATNSVTAADFRQLCQQHNIPVQSFVTRSDMGCGSTIGPITATELGIQTIDIGIPQLAMHSIRELAGTKDCEYMLAALTAFYNR